MQPQETTQHEEPRQRFGPNHPEAAIAPADVLGLEPQTRVLIRTGPGSVGLYTIWRNDTGPHDGRGVWAEPFWAGPEEALRLSNGTGPSRALLERRVLVTRQVLEKPRERFVWWCECGTASEKGFHDTEGFREARKCLNRHRRDKKCNSVCGVASYDNLEARKAWAQVWFRKIRKGGA